MTDESNMNAVAYLRNFIDTHLAITWAEDKAFARYVEYKTREKELATAVKEIKNKGDKYDKAKERILLK